MEQGTKLAVMVAMLTKDQIVEILQEDLNDWKNKSPQQKEDSWKELGFKASLILMKDMAPDMSSALKIGRILDTKFKEEPSESPEDIFMQGFRYKPNNDVN